MNARLLAALCASALLLACGGSVPRPDGGVAVCDPNVDAFLPVKVLDANDQPVAGAEVTAKNVATGKTISGTTNEQGTTTAVSSSLGSGSVTVTARKDTKVSNTGQANFVCGECSCTYEPESVTLKLNP